MTVVIMARVLAEIVRDNFTKLGGEVTEFQAVTPGETDFTAILSTVAAGNPELVYFGGYTAEASVIANQMKQTGLENAKFFGCDGVYGADFITKQVKIVKVHLPRSPRHLRILPKRQNSMLTMKPLLAKHLVFYHHSLGQPMTLVQL